MLFIAIIAVAALVLVVASFVVLRRSDDTLTVDRIEPSDVVTVDDVAPKVQPVEEREEPRPTFADRLGTARQALGGLLGGVFSGRIEPATWDALEEALIRADVGVTTSLDVIETVRSQASDRGVTDSADLRELVKTELVKRLEGFDRSLHSGSADGPAVWLFVGVNGVGKTTTIGKLARRQRDQGQSVLLAAGDTFRAAAAEQLTMWAERSDVPIVRGGEGADPSSVVFDAVESANARKVDLVLADTAGRLQNKTNLMEELSKVRRVAEKGAGSVTETLLVLDATTGQNGLSQAKVFAEAVDVTGVVLTKLDGSAKGGIVVAIHCELGVPVKLVGLGEGINDLVEFDPTAFVDALMG
jgi:fused signal recognition particle receptor